ncbi:MAG: alanyl-tRNA editing protein, partial [Chloroflexota bacterium]
MFSRSGWYNSGQFPAEQTIRRARMTTQRLYYSDAYTTTFDARCVERTEFNGAPAVVLDRSYFYPTSGGQPHDTGTLNGIPVVEVAARESDGAVLHALARPLDGDQVRGEIDWGRRFDHMQNHTGQHILS